MRNITSIALGTLAVIAIVLLGYWFWVPDVGALRTWDQFLDLPTMRCTIGDSSVKGLTGTMYVGNGRLRADYNVTEGSVNVSFHTIVYEDGTTYTWADTVDYARKSVLNIGGESTEAGLFKISRCTRVWNLDPQLFVIPLGKEFKDAAATPVETTPEGTEE